MEEMTGKKAYLAILATILVVVIIAGVVVLILKNENTTPNEVEANKVEVQENVTDEEVTPLNQVETSEVESKIKELTDVGYKEVELKNDLEKWNDYASEDANYTHSIVWNYDKVLNIKEDGQMYVGDKDTGYKYKMTFGGEYKKLFLTEDDYLYDAEEMKTVVDSKVKTVLVKEDEGTDRYTMVFEDGHTYELAVS